jgi:hypothetical protein
MAKKQKLTRSKLIKDKAFRAWYQAQSKEHLKELYNTTKNKNLKSALLRLNNDAVRAARKKIVSKGAQKTFLKSIGSKALGVLGFMGAGTLSASATPTDEQKGVNKKQNVDFEAVNKDLAKAMYKPLTKKKKGGKKYRGGGFLEPKTPNLDDL